MKIRNGFVSNSSSSSFVCIAKPGVITRLLKDEDDTTVKIVQSYLNSENANQITLDGNTYEMWQFTISTEDFGCDFDLTDEESADAYDRWRDFVNKLSQLPNIIIRKNGY